MLGNKVGESHNVIFQHRSTAQDTSTSFKTNRVLISTKPAHVSRVCLSNLQSRSR